MSERLIAPHITEAEIYGMLSTIARLQREQAFLAQQLRDAGKSDWALNVEANGGANRGIVAQIEATLRLEIPAAVQRREAAKETARFAGVDISEVDPDLLAN